MRDPSQILCPRCSLMHEVGKWHTPQNQQRWSLYWNTMFDQIGLWAIIVGNWNTFFGILGSPLLRCPYYIIGGPDCKHDTCLKNLLNIFIFYSILRSGCLVPRNLCRAPESTTSHRQQPGERDFCVQIPGLHIMLTIFGHGYTMYPWPFPVAYNYWPQLHL